MTQAEKAMAYDEALGKAEEFYNDKNNIQCVNVEGMLEEIFPELKESEDEEIRKGLIKAFGSIGKKEWGGVNVKNAIVWLEKQGEKKPVIEMITPEESLGIESETYNEIVNACIFGENKPKFKVGDWVVNNTTLNLCHILKVEHGQYICSDCSFPITKEKEYHLWTIQDAKDGDVLVDVYGNIGIFEKHDDFDWTSYCSLGCNGGFRCFRVEHENDKAYPATKEQRDLLFSKMEEARYMWDSEKKELKNIEQNSAWSEEDDYNVQCLVAKVVSDIQNGNVGRNQELIDWLKSLKQRIGG